MNDSKSYTNGIAIAGFIIGLSSVFLYFIPIFGLIVCILAVILSSVGLAKSNKVKRERGKGINKGFSIAGLVLGIVFLISSLKIHFEYDKLADKIDKEMEKLDKEMEKLDKEMDKFDKEMDKLNQGNIKN